MASRVVKQSIPGEPKLGIKEPKMSCGSCGTYKGAGCGHSVKTGNDADGVKQQKR